MFVNSHFDSAKREVCPCPCGEALYVAFVPQGKVLVDVKCEPHHKPRRKKAAK